MDKRNHPRIAMTSLHVDASDGNGFFEGIIADISRFGVSIKGFPEKLNERTKKLIIVISGQGQNFKMNVKPKWSTTDGISKSVGAEILSPPWGWTEFVMNYEPRIDNDVWDGLKL